MGVLELKTTLTAHESGARSELSHGYQLHIDFLENWLCRIAVVPHEPIDNTWMIAPPEHVWLWQGRERLSTDGYRCPSISVANDKTKVSGGNLSVVVADGALSLIISRVTASTEQPILEDRQRAAYRLLPGRRLFQHAQIRNKNDLHLGLGDKTGPLDRTGRRFRCLQLDALGYNAETSDPLYKHAPWIMVGNNERGYCGVFYDTFAETNFDFGAEHSNYHPHFRSVETHDKALVYYVIDGPSLAQVVQRFQRLVGKPHLQPRWALGFAHTSMHLADADNAQQQILDFVDTCRQRDIPISAVHSGSGYTTRDDGRRYVFTWNSSKFPDRNAFFSALEQAGLRTCANIKPVLLTEHPLFEQVAGFGGFIKDAHGNPAIEQFWGGAGASLDFTNAQTVRWWQQGVSEQVLGAGFTATWNDNNECEIWDEQATVAGFGKPRPAMDMRPVQALSMVRASFEATVEHKPQERPYSITRAGPVGISRYAQTWSGDNRTSWHTLHWNMANGLSMAMSGFPFVGHDIGGFDGPKPDAELLCRWVEMMALHPRAVMNSWKPQESNPATLPWMYEQVEPQIKQALNLRYRFLPLIYHPSWQSHTSAKPLISPLMLHFTDADCVGLFDQFMLGPDVLVAPVTKPGLASRRVYLPVVAGGWFTYSGDKNDGQHQAGGQWIEAEAPLGRLPVFVRSGAVLPIAVAWHVNSPHDATEVDLVGFAGSSRGEAKSELFFDDGVSWHYQRHDASLLSVSLSWSATAVTFAAAENWTGRSRPVLAVSIVGLNDRQLQVLLPD